MNLTNFLVQPGPVRAEHKIVASLPAFGLSLKNTINSCKQTANKEAGVGPCLEGVFGTVMAFGGAASASKTLGHRIGRLMMPHRFLEDGTVNLVCLLGWASVFFLV